MEKLKNYNCKELARVMREIQGTDGIPLVMNLKGDN